MSIHSASAKTLDTLHLAKASIAQQALFAAAKILATPVGDKRDEIRASLFPGLFQAAPDPRNPQFADVVKAPYGTCQIFIPQENDVVFVASDIHGDLESLVACADRALAECGDGGGCPGKKPILFILGDLIDRGPNSAECIAFVLRLALGKDEQREGLRVLLVRGDHDVALNCLADGRITASVSPADFAERFAEDESGDSLCSADAFLARAFARFVQLCCPAAALLSNGILMAHGAVPHSDLQNRLGMDLTIWSPPCAQDFSWCRLRTDKPSKAPNRYSKTSEMGVQNFAGFIEMLNGLSLFQSKNGLNHPMESISVFINGHEHCENGYRACSVQLAKGCCEVHNLTSFTERDLADEVTMPAYLIRLDGRKVVPFAVINVGEPWHEDIPAVINSVVNEEISSENGVLPSSSRQEQEGDNPPTKQCEISETLSSVNPLPPCKTENDGESLPKPDVMPSSEQHDNHVSEAGTTTDDGEETRKRFFGLF